MYQNGLSTCFAWPTIDDWPTCIGEIQMLVRVLSVSYECFLGITIDVKMQMMSRFVVCLSKVINTVATGI